MYKDELIHLHQLLMYLMRFLMDNGVPKSFFEEYTEIGISPHHIHKTKTEHKYAIFVLSSAISNVLSENSETVPRGATTRLKRLAQRCKRDMIERP